MVQKHLTKIVSIAGICFLLFIGCYFDPFFSIKSKNRQLLGGMNVYVRGRDDVLKGIDVSPTATARDALNEAGEDPETTQLTHAGIVLVLDVMLIDSNVCAGAELGLTTIPDRWADIRVPIPTGKDIRVANEGRDLIWNCNTMGMFTFTGTVMVEQGVYVWKLRRTMDNPHAVMPDMSIGIRQWNLDGNGTSAMLTRRWENNLVGDLTITLDLNNHVHKITWKWDGSPEQKETWEWDGLPGEEGSFYLWAVMWSESQETVSIL